MEAERIADTVAAACSAGCRWVQLRHRRLSDVELLRLARELRRISSECGARLTVNARLDVALAAGADGLHLPASGIGADIARKLLPSPLSIGRSTHDPEEIAALAEQPIDYLQFGPVFATPSKTRFGPPQGLERLRAAAAAAGRRPLIAVGGIDARRVAALLEAGASGVAVIRAVSRARDVRAATAALLDALTSNAQAERT